MNTDFNEINHICMNCMRQKGDSSVCPYCGFEDRATQRKPFLPIKSIIGDRYIIGRLLGANGDGATYMGYDLREHSPIIVREFLPETLVVRNTDMQIEPASGYEESFEECYNDFLELWRGLAKLRELSGVMTVYDILEDYGTVYVISEYIETITYRDYLSAQPGGRLPWEEIKKLFMPLLSTIDELHKAGIVHGCISPNSLRVCKDGKLRLFQFSITEVRTTGVVLPTALSRGFAALEQYSQNDTIGPWSDVYSFCAVLYRSLSGILLPEAPQRISNETIHIPEEVERNTPSYVLDAIWSGLRVNPKIRTRNLTELHDMLYGVKMRIAEAVKKNAQPSAVEEYQPPKKKKGKGGIVALIIIVLILAATAALALTVFKDKTYAILGITQTLSQSEHTTSDEMVTVPDFVNSNMTKEQIKSNIIWNDNFYIVFEDGTDLHAEINHVFNQSVQSGESVNKGTQIVLDVCVGRPDVELPDVVGMRQEDALKNLENLGFDVNVVTVENDGTKTTGLVSQMSKEAGITYKYGTEVMLSVYAAPADETTSSQSQ